MKIPTTRTCIVCQAVIRASGDRTLLENFADHESTHNASPAQWKSAYGIIQRDRERVKKESAKESRV